MGGNPPLGYDVVNKKLIPNAVEAANVRTLFEKYLELQSVNALTEYASAHNIYAKQWTTAKGVVKGGRSIAKMSMHRILRDRTYIGQIVNKTDNTVAPGEHQAILPTELFECVQTALRNNANNKSETHASPNLLTGKLFNHDGGRFTNRRTCGKNKTNTHYYATRGFYLPAPTVDEIAIKTVVQFLDADLSALPSTIIDAIKRINIQNAPYAEKKAFIQSLVDKVIYSQDKLIFYLAPDVAKLRPFATNNFINQKSEPMGFTINDRHIVITVPIILRKYVNTVFDQSKNGVLTVTDNNHLILKAFATAWRYREMYEECGDADKIIASEHTSPRQFYRHLDLAYMNPETVNRILSGQQKINVNDLFHIAKKHLI